VIARIILSRRPRSSPSGKRLVPWFLLLVMAGLTRPAPASAQCPESGWTCGDGTGGGGGEPAMSGECWSDTGPGYVSFDSVLGTAHLFFESGGFRLGYYMSDRFEFTPDPGSRGFSIRLHCKGSSLDFASGRVYFYRNGSGAGDGDWGHATPGPDGVFEFDDSLDVPLRTDPDGAIVVGILFLMNDSARRLDVRTQFEFVDLPPGTIVRSCKGYLQEQPTPAAARSWGRLKAAYL
jgi:hypothetical protein